jgi:peptide deformylase|tara:strand:- start:3258 stop:3854 length:597 start_codon:yes stop_codon:yes gene_type:complete
MRKVINCIKYDNSVINKKLREVSVEEGRTIATELFQILNKRGDGIGLAANQVGIDAQVAVVNVREPLVLINPKIIEQWDDVDYYEGCLSYPKNGLHTKRYKNIIIKTEQEECEWYFSGVETGNQGKGSWEKEQSDKQDQEQRLLEAICVQHEIDHLMGKTIHDRENKPKPIVMKKSVGRNEPCHCGSGKKYKKCCINK